MFCHVARYAPLLPIWSVTVVLLGVSLAVLSTVGIGAIRLTLLGKQPDKWESEEFIVEMGDLDGHTTVLTSKKLNKL